MDACKTPYHIKRLTTVVLPSLFCCLSTTYAEEPKTWSGDIEFGYADVSGNSDTQTLKSKFDIKREVEKWRNHYALESLNTSDDGERSAEKYLAAHKTDYKLTDLDYLFAAVTYEDDRFSGFDYQATVAVGYGRLLINDDKMRWSIEGGPGYRKNNAEDNANDTEEVILNLATNYKWALSDNATFGQEVSVQHGTDNTISKSVTSLQTKIAGAFGLKLAYTIKYTDEVPDDKEHADTETIVTLVYSF